MDGYQLQHLMTQVLKRELKLFLDPLHTRIAELEKKINEAQKQETKKGEK